MGTSGHPAAPWMDTGRTRLLPRRLEGRRRSRPAGRHLGGGHLPSAPCASVGMRDQLQRSTGSHLVGFTGAVLSTCPYQPFRAAASRPSHSPSGRPQPPAESGSNCLRLLDHRPERYEPTSPALPSGPGNGQPVEEEPVLLEEMDHVELQRLGQFRAGHDPRARAGDEAR